jgi:hypothetical protein
MSDICRMLANECHKIGLGSRVGASHVIKCQMRAVKIPVVSNPLKHDARMIYGAVLGILLLLVLSQYEVAVSEISLRSPTRPMVPPKFPLLGAVRSKFASASAPSSSISWISRAYIYTALGHSGQRMNQKNWGFPFSCVLCPKVADSERAGSTALLQSITVTPSGLRCADAPLQYVALKGRRKRKGRRYFKIADL